MRIREYEPDTEVDGLMPLDGIDLIGVDWEMPSARWTFPCGIQSAVSWQPTAYT